MSLTPQQKTALGFAAPILLLIAQRFIPPTTLGTYLALAAQVLAAVISILNLIHVPSWVVEIMQAFLQVVTPLPATAETVPQIKPALMARARKIVAASAAVVMLCLCVSCGTPVAQQATNDAKQAAQPALVCAEGVLLTEIGVEDPAAVVADCVKFGALVVADVVQLAQMLIAQLFPPSDAGMLSAASPLRVHLQHIITNGSK